MEMIINNLRAHCQKIWFFALVVSLLLAAKPLIAEEPSTTIIIEQSGTVTFDEMIAAENLRQPTQKQEVAPFMPAPPAREIDDGSSFPPLLQNPSAPLEQPLVPEDEQGFLGPTPNPAFGFLALEDNNTTIPPDTMGAVGPNHLMTMLNSQVRIQDKDGNAIGTVSLATFWTAGTGLTANSLTDPKVIFDSLSDRWIATTDANPQSVNSKVFFAISQTNDPTGAWDFFSFPGDDGEIPGTPIWNDYPGFGVNKNWIAITNNMFGVSGGFFGAKMWVIDKATALSGGPLTVSVFTAGFDAGGLGTSGFTLQPALTFDPAQEKLYIVDNSGWSSGGTFLVRISEISGTGPAPIWSLTPDAAGPFPGTGFFFVANNFQYTQINASQLGTAALVQTNDPRMLNAVFRNGRIWCTHSAALPASGTVDRTAVFWYQLDPTQLNGTGLPIAQSGVLDGGPGVHHFFPSITANKNNDAYVGFSRSDATKYVEAVGTGRLSTDPLGTMDPIVVLKAGEDSYVKDFSSGRIRWGDYSATTIDPTDDLSFWTIQEYAALDAGPTANDDRWSTWWSCIGPCAPPSDTDKIGVFRPSNRRFYLDLNNNGVWDAGDVIRGSFGIANDLPIIGDWNGDGFDQIGVFRPSNRRFYLDLNNNGVWDAGDVIRGSFGIANDLPIIGDWNGDGFDQIGVFRPSNRRFYLDLNNNGVWDAGDVIRGSFGIANDLPIIGDWNGDGFDQIGVFRPSNRRFYLDLNNNGVWDAGDVIRGSFGIANDLPIIGDWNGDGFDQIGVFRPSNRRFYLDLNNNGVWDAGDVIRGSFGIANDLPVIGKW